MTKVLATNGVPVRVCDASEEAHAAARDTVRVELAASPCEAAAKTQTPFTCLPNNAIRWDRYLEKGGISRVGSEGLVPVCCSPVSLAVTRELYEAERDRKISAVDASMQGSVPQGEAGTLGFVVGGDAAALATVAPYAYAGRSGRTNLLFQNSL